MKTKKDRKTSRLYLRITETEEKALTEYMKQNNLKNMSSYLRNLVIRDIGLVEPKNLININ